MGLRNADHRARIVGKSGRTYLKKSGAVVYIFAHPSLSLRAFSSPEELIS